MSDLQISDAQLSSMVAKQAGQLLLELRDSFGDIDAADKDRANELRKAGDAAANEFIVAALREARPDDAILSEEEKDNELRLAFERVWIVDPLDGTYEYGQGRADFAVHIALWHASEQRLSACTVDLPAQELTRTMSDAGASPAPLPTDRAIRIVASRSRPPATLGATVEILAHLLADAGKLADDGVNGLVDSALQGSGVGTGGDILETLFVDGLGEHGRGRCSVTGDVAGLGSNLTDELGAHVLERALKLNLLGDADAVLGDRWAAEFLVEDDVATRGPKRCLDCLGEFLDTAQECVACGLVELELFSCHNILLCVGWLDCVD